MATRTLDSMKGLMIISADAFNIGEVTDIRYDTNWDVVGIKAKTEKSMSKKIPAIGSGRSFIRIAPGDFIINDVMLMNEDVSDLGNTVTADADNVSALTFLEGKKVVSKENVVIGMVHNINVDTDLWTVPTISVKLDKVAFEPLNLKKGLLSKTVISIRTEHIATASDIITLNQGIEDMREEVVVE